MAYFDGIDDQQLTSEAEAENRRRMLGMLAGAGRTSVLGNRPETSPITTTNPPGSRAYDISVSGTNQPNVPKPRFADPMAPTEPNFGVPALGNKPPLLGPSAQPVRPNVMPQRSDFPEKKLPTWEKVLGIGAAPFAPAVTGAILGGPRREADRQYNQATQDWERGQTDAARAATTNEANARAESLRNPKPEKPENLDREAYDFYVSQGMSPAKARQQVLQDATDAKAKEPAPAKENKAVAGTISGKPAWGVQTDKGWIDPQTQASIPNFKPAPSFAQTGFYEPVEVPQTGGGMAPGVFNKRTGQTTPMAPSKAPVPREAQKQVDESLSTARGMDRLERAQGQILQGVEKRGTSGPMGGGPYLNGPESMQFVANHIAVTFGSVKGARIGRDIIEQHVKARDLDQTTEALAQRVLSGGIITYQQAQQMMETAKINRRQAWQQAQDAASQYGVPDAVKMPDDLAQGDTVNVIAPDGTPGTIPRANLKKALGRGYKQAP